MLLLVRNLSFLRYFFQISKPKVENPWQQSVKFHFFSPFKLSGSSVLPAYPGFIVMNAAQDWTSLISRPSKTNRLVFIALAFLIVINCWAMTERTSMSILLNSVEKLNFIKYFHQISKCYHQNNTKHHFGLIQRRICPSFCSQDHQNSWRQRIEQQALLRDLSSFPFFLFQRGWKIN